MLLPSRERFIMHRFDNYVIVMIPLSNTLFNVIWSATLVFYKILKGLVHEEHD